MNVSSVKNLNGGVLSAVQDASLTNVIQTNSGNWQDITAYQNASATYLTEVSIPESATWNEVSTTVQTNSAQWGQGGGAISSYTTVWGHEVPPYGDHVINTLNEKYISAFYSNSADRSNFANNANIANSSNYAETVNETYLENKGFSRNLTSEYGTVSIIHNNIIESTNSAIVRTGNEGFVSSYDSQSIGPEGNGTVTFSWDKSLPNTIINLYMSWSNNEILTYSANTNLTGEIVLPTGVNTQTINIPNATEFKVWSNIWIGLNSATVSAADQFETVVGELAWTSALPTYEYDTNTNKISAINGSALAGGNTEVESYVVTNSASIDDTVNNVTTNSGVWGGSALPISAGPGIGLNLDNNVLIISSNGAGGGLYSTSALLYQGSKNDQRTSAWNLTESISSYKMIQCDWIDTNNYFISKQIPIPSGLGNDMTRASFFDAVFEWGSDLWCKAQRFSAHNNKVYAQVDEYCVHTDGTVSNVGNDVQNNRPIMVQIIGVK